MISPTNFHIPSHDAEGLARYDQGLARLEDAIPPEDLNAVYGVLDTITNPSADFRFGVGEVVGHQLFLIDDHSQPVRVIGVDR
ncbi:MAG TPA: hypothetical protein VMR08_00135 [Patescibacteria group bacterium]|jgi:hypothetical protein|nr:hypothetical protein [Patescibacteria group bacterium]